MIRGWAALAIGAGFAVRAALWWRRIGQDGRTTEPPRLGERRAPVPVVVPVLNEQARLPGLVEHVAKLRADGEPVLLVLVSTEREVPDGGPTTARLCAEYAREEPDWICHHHVRAPSAAMAAQFNAALRDCDRVSTADVVSFYNADSRPAPESCSIAAAAVQDRPGSVVVQQHAHYLRNWARLRELPAPARPVLLAAASWQTRWSIGFERFHARRAAEHRRSGGTGRNDFNYVIGHGLTAGRALLDELGRFTERFPNEDAHLSLALAERGVLVLPSPRWELADSPDTLRGLFVQKRVWFTGPAWALRYARDLGGRGGGAPVRRWWSAARLFHHAVCWLGGPVLFVGGLVLPTRDRWSRPALLLAVLAYTALCNDRALVRAARDADVRVDRRDRIEAAAGAPVAYAMHGASALWATVLLLRHLLVGAALSKPRTPMRRGPDVQPEVRTP